jgi:hypothetical protein
MADPTHFFSLPREIRDQIYGYLYSDTSFDWLFQYGRGNLRHAIVRVEVRNVPLLNLLLACSRTYLEFTEPVNSKKLSMTLSCHSFELVNWDRARMQPRTKELHGLFGFGRLKHATMILCDVWPYFSQVEWEKWSNVANIIRSKSPELMSIRVGFRGKSTLSDLSSLTTSPTSIQGPPQDSIPAPPSILAGFPLRQVCRSFFTEGADPMPLARQELAGAYYDCSRVGLFSYGMEDQEHEWWTKEDVLERFPPRLFTQELLDAVPLDKREADAPAPLKVHQWVDKRGEELENWDDLKFDEKSEARLKAAQREEGFEGWFD